MCLSTRSAASSGTRPFRAERRSDTGANFGSERRRSTPAAAFASRPSGPPASRFAVPAIGAASAAQRGSRPSV